MDLMSTWDVLYSPLVDSDGVMICNMSQSYLVDGCSPAIDTIISDWASQLVTVRKTQNDDLTFDHVLLTFGFDTAVTLTSVVLELFLCRGTLVLVFII